MCYSRRYVPDGNGRWESPALESRTCSCEEYHTGLRRTVTGSDDAGVADGGAVDAALGDTFPVPCTQGPSSQVTVLSWHTSYEECRAWRTLTFPKTTDRRISGMSTFSCRPSASRPFSLGPNYATR